MKFKTLVNSLVLFVGLGLVVFSRLSGLQVRIGIEEVPIDLVDAEVNGQNAIAQGDGIIPEVWQVKEGSVYDGDTLRVVRGSEELRIRFCGIDAPEKKMPMGIESRDHLRSLVNISNGEVLLIPIEQDRYDRTVAEIYVKDSLDTAINLNVQMVRDGYAWHYEQYSGSCPVRGEFAIAQKLAQEEGLGIWKGNPQPPWEWRKANK